MSTSHPDVGGGDIDHTSDEARNWLSEAIRRVDADANRSADTHLHVYPMPASSGVDLDLKDESVHPTGSLKHRLARSLFLYALCNGWITEGATVVEASSGSTAVSEAYFARLLDLPFVAVMPASTSKEKIELIDLGLTLICDAGDRYAETYYDDGWLAANDLHIDPYLDTLERFAATGIWNEPA
jgi:cysteine synthase A